MKTQIKTPTKNTNRKPRSGGAKGETKLRLRLQRGGSPAVAVQGAGEVETVTLPVETAQVKLDADRHVPVRMLAMLTRLVTGMASVADYADLAVLTDLSGGRTGLATLLTNLENQEAQLKETRLTLAQWMQACSGIVNRAALACENANSTPGTLLQGGWQLRRTPGPSHEMPAPQALKLRQTKFAGQAAARWKAVRTARYYEVQVDPVPGAPLTIAESTMVVSARVEAPLPPLPPGSQVQICVRAVGAKGPGPFCDALVGRVN